jgi:arsenite methyltransferase
MPTVDAEVLEAKVKQMYRLVVEQPHGVYHFAMGRPLAERLGYDPGMLDQVPVEAVDTFAGVGYVFGLAQLVEGERVLDLGSGSGMDACYAAQLVGSEGRVIGIDFTPSKWHGPGALPRPPGWTRSSSTRQDRKHPGRRRQRRLCDL